MTPAPRISLWIGIIAVAASLLPCRAQLQGWVQPDGKPLQRSQGAPSAQLVAPSPQTLAGASSTLRAKPSAAVGAIPVQPAAQPPSGAARSMLDQPASAPTIQVTQDGLAIQATNASLSDVLRDVAARTGMQVEGNSRDERVFGNYGPGRPADVLSALLYDSGYNVMMIGVTSDGAPRRLLLTARTLATAPPSSSASTSTAHNADDDDEQQPDTPAEAAPPIPSPFQNAQPGPGAVTPPGQVKTPQQMLEELQRMHQGQQPQDLPHEP